MRVDHHAYRKATRVAGFGFLLQAAIAMTLLVFAIVSADTVFRFAAYYLFGGLLVWLSLIVVFYQHTQQRLEALEEDELAASRGGASVFESHAGERVAARRLRLMHSWLMPAVSVLLAVYLGLGAAVMLRHLGGLDDPSAAGSDFLMTGELGWAIAVSLFFAAVCFIFSRFVAGMARLTAWQNLRGGAAYMVGNALVMLAAAVGIILRFFENEQVMLWIAYAIPAFMLFLVVEIVIHFILNIYRPRIPGEVPRPAFDSRVLSLLAAPESIVRSLNEAVNYQFGFDITSSWGYQLLLRSFGWLLLFGAMVLVFLNMMVVIEPHQQAIKLSGGEIVGNVHGSGIMWKLPWPFETADVYDVGRIRRLPLTAQRLEHPNVQLWSETIETDRTREPFLVGGVRAAPLATGAKLPDELYSLVDAEISLLVRIKPDGLLDFLNFASDLRRRRQDSTMRENALRALALRTVTQHLSALTVDDVIAAGRGALIESLRGRIQETFDAMSTGIEVVAVNVPLLRPAGNVAKYYDDYATAKEQRRETVAKAEEEVSTSLAFWIGDADRAGEILSLIEQWKRLRDELGPDDTAVIDKRIEIEGVLTETGGALAQEIAAAEAQRWIELLRARADVYKHQGELAAYQAAPHLYREREIMRVLTDMANRRKYVFVGVDPSRVKLDVELQESPALFNFSDALSSEGTSK